MCDIPKIIHFLWVDFSNELNQNPVIPEKHLANLTHTKLLHPDYQIKIWNGYECDQLVNKYFPSKYKIYWSLQKPIMRCDFARLVILYVFGGIYSDMDRISLKTYNEILSKYSEYDFITSKTGDFSFYDDVNNDIMFATKQNDFVFQCIQGIKKHNAWFNLLNVFLTAGPLYMQQMYRRYKGPSKNIALHTEFNACTMCDCKMLSMGKMISYTTFDGSWDPSTAIIKSIGSIYCNFYKIAFFVLLAVLLYWKIKNNKTKK